MRCLRRHRTRLFAAVVAIGALGAVVAMPAQPARARYTMYVYKAKVAIKGGTTLSNAYSGTGAIGDVQHESSTSSFSVDAKIRSIVFFKGKVPSAMPRTLESGAATVINGTWSDQGEKWLDPAHGTKEPFTCGGKITSTAPPGNMSLKTTRTATKVKLTLACRRCS